MKKKKYLDLYYRLMQTGKLIEHGLCDTIEATLGSQERVDFVAAFRDNSKNTGLWGYDGTDYAGWALGDKYERIAYDFNDLRQNMLLFMAAINNEL